MCAVHVQCLCFCTLVKPPEASGREASARCIGFTTSHKALAWCQTHAQPPPHHYEYPVAHCNTTCPIVWVSAGTKWSSATYCVMLNVYDRQVWSILSAQAELLGVLESEGQELLVARGGRGGRGNALAPSNHQRPASKQRSDGKPGEEVSGSCQCSDNMHWAEPSESLCLYRSRAPIFVLS
jgi:hypothetical protein